MMPRKYVKIQIPVFYSHYLTGDSLGYHGDRAFTTRDRDNDITLGNCALTHKGGWWYGGCQSANLNGLYLEGPYESEGGATWLAWRGHQYSLKKVEMKMRRMP